MDLEWMAWTPVTAGFFITIFTILLAMGIWEVVSPTVERRGLLPIPTTRGDRLFIGLLGCAYITIAWMGLTDWSLYFAIPVFVVFVTLVMKFG
jgi:predicted small integral membrane protein